MCTSLSVCLCDRSCVVSPPPSWRETPRDDDRDGVVGGGGCGDGGAFDRKKRDPKS